MMEAHDTNYRRKIADGGHHVTIEGSDIIAIKIWAILDKRSKFKLVTSMSSIVYDADTKCYTVFFFRRPTTSLAKKAVLPSFKYPILCYVCTLAIEDA